MTKDLELENTYDYISVDSIVVKDIENSNYITGDTNHLYQSLRNHLRRL